MAYRVYVLDKLGANVSVRIRPPPLVRGTDVTKFVHSDELNSIDAGSGSKKAFV